MNKTGSRLRRLVPSSQKQPNTQLALVPHPPKSIPAILISKNSTSVDSDSDRTLSLKSPDEPVLNGVNKVFPHDTQETASSNQSHIRARTYNVTKKPHRRVTWETPQGDDDVNRGGKQFHYGDESNTAVSLFGDATKNNGRHADDMESAKDFLSPTDYTDPHVLDVATDETDDDFTDDDDQQTPLSTKSDLTHVSSNRAAIKSYLSGSLVKSSKTNHLGTKAMLSSGPADENSPKRNRTGHHALLGLRKEDTFVVADRRSKLGTISPSEDLRRRKAMALAKANARHLLKKRSGHHFYDKSNESHYNFRTRSNSQGNQNRKRAYIENTGQEVINDRGEKISFHWQESQGSAKGRNHHVPRGPKAIEKLHQYKKQRARHKYSPVMFTKSAPDKKEKSDVREPEKNNSEKRSKTATIRKNDDENVNKEDDSISTPSHHRRNEIVKKPERRFMIRPKEAFVDGNSQQSDSDISDVTINPNGKLNGKHQHESDRENARFNNTHAEAKSVSIHKYSKLSTGAPAGNVNSREESFTDHEGDSKHFTNNPKMPHPPSSLYQNKSNSKVPSKSKHNLPSNFNPKQQNGTGSKQASHPGLINDKTTIIVGHHSNNKVGHGSDSNLDLKFGPEKNERVPTKAISLSNINNTRTNNGAIQTTTNAKLVSTTADNDLSTNAGRKLTSINGKTSGNLRYQITHKEDAVVANSLVPDTQKIPSTPSTDITAHDSHSSGIKTGTNSRGTDNQNEPVDTKYGNKVVGDSQSHNTGRPKNNLPESNGSKASGINCKTIKAVENRDNNSVDINVIAGNVHQPEKQRSSSNIEIDLTRDNTNKTNNITQSKTTQKDFAANHQRSDKQTLKLTDHEDETVNKADRKISDGAETRSGSSEKSDIYVERSNDKRPQVPGVNKTQTKGNLDDSKEEKEETAVSEAKEKNNSIEINHISKLDISSKDVHKTSSKISLPVKSEEPYSNVGFDQNSKFKAPTEHLNNKKVQNEHVNSSLNKKTNVLNRKGNRETNQAPTTDQSNRDAAGTNHHIDSHSVNKTARRGSINGETDNRKQFDHMVMRETQQRMTGGEGPGDDLIFSEKREQPGRDNTVAVTTHQIKENNMDASIDVKRQLGKEEKKESAMTQDEQNLSDPQEKRHSGTESAHTLDKVSESNANETKVDLVPDKNANNQNLSPVQYDLGDNIDDTSNAKESVEEDNVRNEQKNQLNTNKPMKEALKLELTQTNKGDIKDTTPPSINRYQTQSSSVPSEYNLHSFKSSHASASVFTVDSEAPCGKSSSTEIDGSAKRLSENSDPNSTHHEVDIGSVTGNHGELFSYERDKSVLAFRELCRRDDINNQASDSRTGSISSQGTKIDDNVRNKTAIAGSLAGDYETGNQQGPTGKSDLQNVPVQSDKNSEIDSVGVSRNGLGGVSKQEVTGEFDRNDRSAPVNTIAVKQAVQPSNGKLEKQKVNNGFQQSRTPIKEHKIYEKAGTGVSYNSYKINDKRKNKPALAIHAQNIEVPEMQTKNKDVKTSNSLGNQGVIHYHNQSSHPVGNNVNYKKIKNQELDYARPETFTKQNILAIKKSEKMNNDVILQKPVLVRPKSAGLSAFAMYESEDLWSVNTGEEDDDHIEFIDGEQDFFKVFGYDEDTAAILMATKVYPISDAIKEIEESEPGAQNAGKPNSGSSSVSGNMVDNGAKFKSAESNDNSATQSNNLEVSKDPGISYSMSMKAGTRKNVIPRADNQSKLTKTTGKQNIESSKNDAERTHGYQTMPVHPDNKRSELTDTKNNSLNAMVNIPKTTAGNNAQPQTKIALVKAGSKNDKKGVESKDATPSNKSTLSKVNEKQSTNQKQGGKGDSKPKPQNIQTTRQQPNTLPGAAATMTLLSERQQAAIQDHVMRRRFHSEADIDSVNQNIVLSDAKGHSNASRTNFASQNNNNHEEIFGYQKRHVRHKSLATNVTQTTTNNPRQSRESMDTLQSTHGNTHTDAKNFKGRHFYRQTLPKTNDEPTRPGDKLTTFNPYTHAADRIMSRFSDTENTINGRNSNNSSDNNMSQSPGASSNNTISTISKTSTDLYQVTKTTGNGSRRMSHPAESRIAHAQQAEVVLAPKQPRKLKPIIHQPGTQRFNTNFSTGLR